MVKRRYFGPMLRAQAKWLNKMSAQGWRLAGTGKLDYTFVPCGPGEYQYAAVFARRSPLPRPARSPSRSGYVRRCKASPPGPSPRFSPYPARCAP